jgi:hypothetical protein
MAVIKIAMNIFLVSTTIRIIYKNVLLANQPCWFKPVIREWVWFIEFILSNRKV